jgi:pyruvate carboxylase
MDYGDGVTNEMIKGVDIVEKKHLVAEGKEIAHSFMEVCSKYIDDKGTSITQLQKSV